MFSPDRSTMCISAAGHLPPMLASGGQVEPVTIPVDLPLGTGSDASRRTTEVPVPEGATLVFYTDGLIERRGEPITEGLERLRAAIEPASAENLCSTLMMKVAERQPMDDVALLTVRRKDDASRT